MTLLPDERDTLDQMTAALTAEEPHLTGMYKVFGKLTRLDLIPNEDLVRPLRRAVAGGAEAVRAAKGPLAKTGHIAKIAALPLVLLGILITIVAFTAGAGSQCTRATSLHGGLVPTCTTGKAAPSSGPTPATGK
jgi:hypothetical protein